MAALLHEVVNHGVLAQDLVDEPAILLHPKISLSVTDLRPTPTLEEVDGIAYDSHTDNDYGAGRV
jgi:hypothetical protein